MGLTVDLELDIEYRFVPAKIAQTALRTGYVNPTDRLLRTGRAEIRNVASLFPVEAFLSGARANISVTVSF